MEKKIIIAIDGYSSSGKSTMARRLASKIGYRYVDTGAMYRAVTLYAMDHGMISSEGVIDEANLEKALPIITIDFLPLTDGTQHTLLCGADVEQSIRSLSVSAHVSSVAAIPFVRAALVAAQKAMGKDKGIVMDGRDIGTAVFPNAELKLFVTASPSTRAERRFKELQQKGDNTTFEEVLENVISRDRMDETRAVSPLRKADDAVVLDNSYMSIPEQEEWLLETFQKRIKEL